MISDWEATNEAIEEQVARESYLQWLRDNERRHAGKTQFDLCQKFLFSIDIFSVKLQEIPSQPQWPRQIFEQPVRPLVHLERKILWRKKPKQLDPLLNLVAHILQANLLYNTW